MNIISERQNVLLVNADDFGLNAAVNEAIDFCFKKGYIQRTTIMVNMPEFDSACLLAKEGDYLDKVGLHLNLVEGCPLTENIKKTFLCDSRGYFNKNIMVGLNRFYVSKRVRKCIEEEIEAQISTFLRAGFSLMHIDSHMHSHINVSVLCVLLSLIEKYDFKSVRLARNIPSDNISVGKKIYKNAINGILQRKNKKNDQKWNICKFGSLIDVEHEGRNKVLSRNEIEVMTHPIMNGGILSDSVSEVNIKEWLETQFKQLKFD